MAEESKKMNKDTNMSNENNGTVEEQVKGMRPIWFFVGLILFFMGLVLIVTGIYNYYHPSQSGVVLDYLHPDLWWGAVMFLVGAGFVWFTRNSTVE